MPFSVHAGTSNIGGDSGDELIFADAGNTQAVVGEYPVDFDWNMRALDDPDTPDTGLAVLGISVDMGAFEFQPEGGPAPTCPGDLNGDERVNVFDLLAVLSAWGACP